MALSWRVNRLSEVWNDLNEKTTYRFGNRSFIVEPVFKEETQNTLGCVLLRLMKSESAGA